MLCLVGSHGSSRIDECKLHNGKHCFLYCTGMSRGQQFVACLAGVAWSLADPWTFASLSYDGRMIVNKVPSHTKYKILI